MYFINILRSRAINIYCKNIFRRETAVAILTRNLSRYIIYHDRYNDYYSEKIL